MPILTVNIGNTNTQFGLADAHGIADVRTVSTHEPHAATNALREFIFRPGCAPETINGLAFCSVVPEKSQALIEFAGMALPEKPLFQLTHEATLGIPVSYPVPGEIGHDRLANVIAARALFGTPAIVVDTGTAITLDVITRENGYEGGVIAPGIDLMRRALHEQTAQLPALGSGFRLDRAIGRSTEEAMQIGCLIGFRGMVDSLLSAIKNELESRGETAIHLIATGGSAVHLDCAADSGWTHVADLTLRGLYEAFILNRAS